MLCIRSDPMNHSLWTASLETHVRVVAVSLVAAIAVVLCAALARTESSDGVKVARPAGVIVARPVIYASNADAPAR
jgi:hypothetical protein